MTLIAQRLKWAPNGSLSSSITEITVISEPYTFARLTACLRALRDFSEPSIGKEFSHTSYSSNYSTGGYYSYSGLSITLIHHMINLMPSHHRPLINLGPKD